MKKTQLATLLILLASATYAQAFSLPASFIPKEPIRYDCKITVYEERDKVSRSAFKEFVFSTGDMDQQRGALEITTDNQNWISQQGSLPQYLAGHKIEFRTGFSGNPKTEDQLHLSLTAQKEDARFWTHTYGKFSEDDVSSTINIQIAKENLILDVRVWCYRQP